ncbi:peptidase, S9A/B/C family, catalytic domain protein [Teladorsagia circumcincta]|uniref:Peptidase, S9A/B/C family, catalytic domain protein n=1 Tax=Teladorsagia circumcincta TaxID=45464 RepID=A0A2G9V1L0_TELCI|nr:peptidase, S9A/B/C family, catalytic domain protein [Teladorsagia circumcincta]
MRLTPTIHEEDKIVQAPLNVIYFKNNGSGRVTAWHGGTYDIKEMKGYDIKTDTLTFTSSGQGVGTMRLYRLARGTSTNQSSIIVLSSLVSDCDYGSYDVSPDGKRAVLACLQAFKNTKLYLMNIDIPSNNRLLDGADEAHIPFDLPELSYETVKLPSGYEVHIGLMKPPKFDPSLKYPMLVDVYGGPNSCRIRRSTPNPNMIHFCSNLGVIVAWIDGRGSSNRGWNMKAPVYKALGQFETIDTIDAVKYLTSKYSYIDNKRVAVFGWSYGGFLSTHIAIRDQGKTFQCAIAVAPVVDFMLYDSAYTERYLGIPLENPGAYNASQLLNKAGRLKEVKYFLAHGEADGSGALVLSSLYFNQDNVHFQNSALLAEALQAELVHFTQLVYPNQDHSIGPRQAHLFMEIGRFLDKECFNNDD